MCPEPLAEPGQQDHGGDQLPVIIGVHVGFEVFEFQFFPVIGISIADGIDEHIGHTVLLDQRFDLGLEILLVSGVCGNHLNELAGEHRLGFNFLCCLCQGGLIPGNEAEAASRLGDLFGGFLSNAFGTPHDHHEFIFKCERIVAFHSPYRKKIVLCKGNNTQKYKTSLGKRGVNFIQFF